MFYIMEYGLQWNAVDYGIKWNMEWNGIPWNGIPWNTNYG
jgi:hypothetical protein